MGKRGIVAAALLVGTLGGLAATAQETEEDAMIAWKKRAQAVPLDAAAPQRVELATFALG